MVAVAGFFVLNTGQSDQDAAATFDDDLCPTDSQRITGSATYLLDLRKPLADAAAPGRFLAAVGRELAEGVELKVFAITDRAAAPRRQLARLCKPYSETDIAVTTAKDQTEGPRDCHNLPAQVSNRTRDLATGFCARRDALRARIDTLAANAPGTVANAYLVEALHDTATTLANRPPPRTLYVFSDMLQHAEWYSQLDLRWTDWSFAAFTPRLAEAMPLAVGPGLSSAPQAPWRAVVFYPLRQRVTAPLRRRYAHQTFWRRYFETQGAQVVFRELPRAPAYHAPELMVTPSEAIAKDIEAVLQDTERRRKAAAQLELALAELERAAPAPDDVAATRPPPQTAEHAEQPAPPPRVVRGGPDETRTGARVDAPPPAVPAVTRPGIGADATRQVPRVPLAGNAGEDPAPAPNVAFAGPQPPNPARRAGTAATPQQAACVIALKPEFAAALSPGGYPAERRVSYGAGLVTVRYTVDAEGRTVDADVVASTAAAGGRRTDSDALALDTANEVRGWEFSFADANPDDCVLTPQTATFNYVERCVGSPVPTCRTVRANVTAF